MDKIRPNLGHQLIKPLDKFCTYYCSICDSVIWYDDNYDRFLVSFGNGIWEHDISCDEMIIKNIIE